MAELRNLTVNEVLAKLEQLGRSMYWHNEGEWSEDITLGDWGVDHVGVYWPWEHDEYHAFFRRLEAVFDFKASKSEWKPLAQDDTTVAQLAAFVAKSASYREIVPATILGRHCYEAGVFSTICRMVESGIGGRVRLRPSTPIRRILNEEAQKGLLWRLHYFFPNHVDDLYHRAGPLEKFRDTCWLATGFCALVSLLVPWMAALGILTLALAMTLMCLCWVLPSAHGTLNRNIQTFRDMVVLVVARERVLGFR